MSRFLTVKNRILLIVLAIVSVVACVFFGHFLLKGALSWTVTQTAFLKAVCEIGVLAILLFTALQFLRTKLQKIAAIGLLLVAFAYVHSFLLPFCIGILYFLLILMTGHFVCCLLVKERANDPAACLVMGLAGLLVLIAGCSVVGIATAASLRIVYVCLFLLELVACRKRGSAAIRSFLSDTQSSRHNFAEIIRNCFLAITIASLMIQVGKANISQDYDFLWYGGRADDILAPYGGIYDKIISTAFIYYYPKGYEALALPFFFEHTYSFIYSVNLMFAAAALLVSYKIAASITKGNIPFFCMMCCAVTAGIMNMAVTAKQDLATLLAQICMIYFAVRMVKDKNGCDFMLSLGAALLSFTFKTTSFVFSGVFLCFVVLVAVFSKIKIHIKNLLVLILPLAAVIAVFMRSYLLTGMPFPLFAQDLLNSIGFTSQYPYNSTDVLGGTSVMEVLTTPLFWERLSRLLHFFFYPNSPDTDHVIIAWGGYLFTLTWFGIVLKVVLNPVKTWKRLRTNGLYAFSLMALILVSILSGGSAMVLGQLDGNYFMFWYVLTFLHAGFELSFLSEDVSTKYTLTAIPVVMCGVILCTASSWAWSLGFTPVDILNRGYYDHYSERYDYYARMQIDQICEHLEKMDRKARVMTFAADFPKIQDIPAAADSWTEMMIWGNKFLADNSDTLYEYFVEANIEFLLVELDFLSATPLAKDDLVGLTNSGHLSIYMQQGDFCLLQFSQKSHATDEILCALLEGKRVLNIDGVNTVLNMSSSLYDYENVVLPDKVVDTPNGTGVFSMEPDSVTIVSGYMNTVKDVVFPENAILYFNCSMPFENSDGAQVFVRLVQDGFSVEMTSFEILPGKGESKTVILNIENIAEFVGDLVFEVTSPSGDDMADWVTFTDAGIFVES